MKKSTLLAASAASLIALTASTAATADIDWNVSPYVGADVQIRHVKFGHHFGNKRFKKNYPQANLFAGIKFCDFLGIELGYETTTNKSRTVTLGTPPIKTNSSARFRGPHADLVGFLPIFNECNLHLLGYVGIAHLKASLKQYDVLANGISPARTFNKHKSVLRLGAGVQHMINDCWGVRALVGWEKTKFNLVQNQPAATPQRVKLKNSYSYGLGAFYSFSL